MSTNKQKEVIDAVLSERDYQNRKWGHWGTNPHEVGAWITLIRGKLDAAASAWCGANNDRAALIELRKIVALGFACLEQHGVEGRSPNQEIKGGRAP